MTPKQIAQEMFDNQHVTHAEWDARFPGADWPSVGYFLFILLRRAQ